MDVNYNMQSGTSIPLADIVESGSGYIKFSNGIAIVYLSSSDIYVSTSKIAPGIYEYKMSIYSPVTFISVYYFIVSMDANVYIHGSSTRYTIIKNATTTKYSTTDNHNFIVAPIIDISGYALHVDTYACSFDTKISNINYLIIGRWK